jgi:hypothetical protein
MSIAIWFWLIYVLSLFFGGWALYPFAANPRPFGAFGVLYLLVGLLGWHVFGSPLGH